MASVGFCCFLLALALHQAQARVAIVPSSENGTKEIPLAIGLFQPGTLNEHVDVKEIVLEDTELQSMESIIAASDNETDYVPNPWWNCRTRFAGTISVTDGSTASLSASPGQRRIWRVSLAAGVRVRFTGTVHAPCGSFLMRFTINNRYNLCVDNPSTTAPFDYTIYSSSGNAVSFYIMYLSTWCTSLARGFSGTLTGFTPGGSSTTTSSTTSGPSPTNCGIPASATARIADGSVAPIEDFPWQVKVYHPVSGGTSICGGTLFTSQNVLTAAHCTENAPSTTSIQVGLGCDPNTPGSLSSCDQVRNAIANNMHPQYNIGAFLINDIAVIRLNSPVSFTNRIIPACLPTSLRSLAGRTFTAVGWGTNENQQLNNELQEADIILVTDTVCTNTYGGVGPLMPTVFCARRGNGNTCGGDSGGFVGYPPTSSSQPWYVDGVVSFGPNRPCQTNDNTWIGGYTDVYHYLSWINANL